MARLRKTILLLLSVMLLASLALPAYADTDVPEAEEKEIPAPQHAAQYAVVIDYETGEELYSYNADVYACSASMSKLMTTYIIFQELELGNIALDTMVPVSDYAAGKSWETNFIGYVPLSYGASYSVEHLLKLILLPSGSAACLVMAEFISGTEKDFVARMNETSATLGLTAEYYNPHGVYPNFSTARSQALLGKALIDTYPQVLEYTTLLRVIHEGVQYNLTNKLLSSHYYEGADGLKTGTTQEAGYCLTSTALRDGKRIIAVVMMSTSEDQRYIDTKNLLDFGFEEIVRRENEARINAPYPDVYKHWSEPAVLQLKEYGTAMSENDDGLFLPDDAITRADFVQMLMSVLEKKGELTIQSGEAFSDTEGLACADAAFTADLLGIVKGYEDGTFRPFAPITREEVAVIIAVSQQLTELNEDFTPSDAELISEWALESILLCGNAGLMTGEPDGTFAPQRNMSRAEAAQLIVRLI